MNKTTATTSRFAHCSGNDERGMEAFHVQEGKG